MTLQVTAHGGKRVRERVGIPKRAVAKLAARAMVDGATHAQFTGSMKRYLDAIYMDHGSANNMRILNGYLFLFADERLVTCWLLPERFRRTKPKAVAS